MVVPLLCCCQWDIADLILVAESISLAYIRCADDVHERLKVAAAKMGATMQDFAAAVLAPVLDGIDQGTITKETFPAGPRKEGGPPTLRNEAENIPKIPGADSDDSVLDLVVRLWEMPGFRDAVADLTRIYEVGDGDIVGAIQQICKVFARASDFQEAVVSGELQGSSTGQKYQRRVEAVLGDAGIPFPTDSGDESTPGGPANGKADHGRMGGRSVREAGGGKR